MLSTARDRKIARGYRSEGIGGGTWLTNVEERGVAVQEGEGMDATVGCRDRIQEVVPSRHWLDYVPL